MKNYGNLTKKELIGVLKYRDACIDNLEINVAKCRKVVAALGQFKESLQNLPVILEEEEK